MCIFRSSGGVFTKHWLSVTVVKIKHSTASVVHNITRTTYIKWPCWVLCILMHRQPFRMYWSPWIQSYGRSMRTSCTQNISQRAFSLTLSSSVSLSLCMVYAQWVQVRLLIRAFFVSVGRVCRYTKKDVYWTRSLANCCAISIRHSGHKRAFKIIFKGWESVFLQGFLILLYTDACSTDAQAQLYM